MNRGKIKEIFSRLAKQLAAANEVLPAGDEYKLSRSSQLRIRGGRLQSPSVVDACTNALNEVVKITEAESIWSRASVDDVIWEFQDRIDELPLSGRGDAVRTAVAEVLAKFDAEPSSWIIDLPVYGVHQDCAGVRFGKIQFLHEDISKAMDVALAECLPGFPTGPLMLARLETAAIDRRSAVQRAGAILDEHLSILNALCCDGMPSWIRISCKSEVRDSYFAVRAARLTDTDLSIHGGRENYRFPLMRPHLDQVITRDLGKRVSAILASEATEFSQRVLRGYQFAGSAVVDRHPERAFLMMTIALESVVLGPKNRSEITYQLAARVAHLIGRGLSGRKLVAKTVTDLYDRRSKIVHSAEYGVTRTETDLVHFYSMNALGLLVLSPAFAGFELHSHLDEWFRDRMLDGADHFEPLSESKIDPAPTE